MPKHYNIIRSILFLIALQILNMSIDIPASMPDNTLAGDFNYIDTYVEYITEVVLKFENAIPESRHRHQKELQLHKHVQVICQSIQVQGPYAVTQGSLIKKYPAYADIYIPGFIKEINPPPPKTQQLSSL